MNDVVEKPMDDELTRTIEAVKAELSAMSDEQILMVYVMLISDITKDEQIADTIGELSDFESVHDMLVHLENVQEAIDSVKGEPPQSLLSQVI